MFIHATSTKTLIFSLPIQIFLQPFSLPSLFFLFRLPYKFTITPFSFHFRIFGNYFFNTSFRKLASSLVLLFLSSFFFTFKENSSNGPKLDPFGFNSLCLIDLALLYMHFSNFDLHFSLLLKKIVWMVPNWILLVLTLSVLLVYRITCHMFRRWNHKQENH